MLSTHDQLQQGQLVRLGMAVVLLVMALGGAACKNSGSSTSDPNAGDSADAKGGIGGPLSCLCADLVPIAARPEYPRLANVTNPRQSTCAYVSMVSQDKGHGSLTVRVRPAASKTAAEAVFNSLSSGFVKIKNKSTTAVAGGSLISAIAESSQGPARIAAVRTNASLVVDSVEYRSDGQFATSTGGKFVQAAAQTARNACL